MDLPQLLLLSRAHFAAGGFRQGRHRSWPADRCRSGCLGLLMTPAQAAAILVVPSLVTNIWQAAVGGGLLALARRLWPHACRNLHRDRSWACVCLPHDDNGRATVWLGLLLVRLRRAWLRQRAVFRATPCRNLARIARWALQLAQSLLRPASSSYRATPYIQSHEFDRDQLVQALGLSFTVSTITLAAALRLCRARCEHRLPGRPSCALVAALVGMGLGQLMPR